MKKSLTVLSAILMLLFSACGDGDEQTGDDEGNMVPAPINLTFQVVNEYPHDREGFTFHNGQLFESTGAPDEPFNNGTWIAAVDLKTGKYDRKVDLGKAVFGEGITFLNGNVYQLTYKSQKGFVYDAKTFKKVREFNYKSEGWGLANDGKHLIMSAGTSNIYYLTPDSLTFVKMLPVQDNKGFVESINELEYINGQIYANRWLTNEILRIDPNTGYVTARLDLTKQVNEMKSKYPDALELNGIAYDSTSGKTYITGKKWPVIYEIKW